VLEYLKAESIGTRTGWRDFPSEFIVEGGWMFIAGPGL
jgi:hypothetical protein